MKPSSDRPTQPTGILFQRAPRFPALRCARVAAWTAMAAICLLSQRAAAATPQTPDLPSASAPAERVGARSRIEAIVTEGNHAFSREAIIVPLLSQLGFHAASHPEAPVEDYLAFLRRHIVHGYRRSGFAEVAVQVTATSNQVRASIREGSRYIAGPVRISGVPADVALSLRSRLQTAPGRASFKSTRTGSVDENLQVRESAPQPAPEITLGWLWYEGRPAPTDEAALSEMRAVLSATLDELGLPGSTVKVSLETERSRAVAELHIEIEPGGAGGSGQANNAARQPPPTLAIDTPEDAALLAFRDWLLSRDRWTHDVVFEFSLARTNQPRFHLEGVLVADGLFLGLHDGASNSNDLPRLAAVFSDGLQALYSTTRQSRLLLPRLGQKVMFTVEVRPHAPGGEAGYEATIGTSFVRSSIADAHGAPFEIRLSVDPEAVVALGRSRKLKPRLRLDAGTLVLESPEHISPSRWRLEIDRATGRLVQWTFESGDPRDRMAVRVRTEPGVFAARVRQLAAGTAGYPNALDPQHPLASSAGFLLAELDPWVGRSSSGQALDGLLGRRLASVIRLLAAMPLDTRIDLLSNEPLLGGSAATGESFPGWTDTTNAAAPPGTDATFALLGAWMIQFSRGLWAPESWPQQLARDAILARTGYPQLVRSSLDRMVETAAFGPLGFLLASLVPGDGDPQLASRLLEAGVARLQSDWAARDLTALLLGPTPDPARAPALFRTITAAPEQDLRRVGEAFGLETGALLGAVRQLLEYLSPARDPVALRNAVHDRWIEDLQDPLRAVLESRPPGVHEPLSPAGQFMRAAVLATGVIGPPDLPAAIPWLRRAAQAGYGPAQMVYGDKLASGEGMPRDPAEAAVWYRRAAAQNVPHADCRLGNLHIEGTGVFRDTAEAALWFARDAAQDCPNAMFQLGCLALQQTPPDWNSAIPWLRRAAELNHAPALHLLSKREEETGQLASARRHLEAAARLGFVPAQADLGDRLGDGITPGQDRIEAWAWLHLAVQGGHRVSTVAMERLGRELSAGQRAEARQRAETLMREISAGPTAAPRQGP